MIPFTNFPRTCFPSKTRPSAKDIRPFLRAPEVDEEEQQDSLLDVEEGDVGGVTMIISGGADAGVNEDLELPNILSNRCWVSSKSMSASSGRASSSTSAGSKWISFMLHSRARRLKEGVALLVEDEDFVDSNELRALPALPCCSWWCRWCCFDIVSLCFSMYVLE